MTHTFKYVDFPENFHVLVRVEISSYFSFEDNQQQLGIFRRQKWSFLSRQVNDNLCKKIFSFGYFFLLYNLNQQLFWGAMRKYSFSFGIFNGKSGRKIVQRYFNVIGWHYLAQTKSWRARIFEMKIFLIFPYFLFTLSNESPATTFPCASWVESNWRWRC